MRKHLNAILETLRSEGWQNGLKPYIAERHQKAILQLASVDRPTNVSDDVLRGHIAALDWVLNFETRANHEVAEVLEEIKDKETPEPKAVGSPMEPDPEVTTTEGE